MFADLNEKLSGVFRRLRGEARITEANIEEAVKQVRLSLLEADVNFKVVKEFITSVKADAVGLDVIKNISPSQQFIKIINDNLVTILGGKDYTPSVPLSPNPPTVIMLVGLQGSGKTTSAGKLSKYFLKQSKNSLMVACDTFRAAAVKQLEVIGKNIAVDVYSDHDTDDVLTIAKDGLAFARRAAKDIVIFDTAGRLHVNDDLMNELVELKKMLNPDYIFFVADSMTGQDAVNTAKVFNDTLDISGVILTKTDGDTRGGAALSIKYVTGKPITFIGTGERFDEFELFHPDRLASRILGMGDIVTLVEKASELMDQEDAEELSKKVKVGLDYNDLLKQFKMMKKLGSVDSILKMVPGLKSKLPTGDMDESKLKRIESIIFSMTYVERKNPDLLNGSRKKRIALGSGTTVNEINKLADQLTQMNKMFKKVGKSISGKNEKDAMKEIDKVMRNIR